MVILARKLSIALVTILLSKNTVFQLAMAILVMFVSYAMQVKHRPYMSPSEYDEVLEDHKLQAQRIGSVHQALQSNLLDVYRRGKMQSARPSTLTRRSAGQMAAQVIFNYNTAEATLLFCAVLVNLAGIMFESGRFNGEYYQQQRDTLLWLTLLVIVASLLYWFVLFVAEVLLTLRPQSFQGLCGRPVPQKRRKQLDASHEDDTVIGAAVNPMFSRMESGAAEATLKSAIAQAGLPSPALWEACRDQIAKLLQQNEDLVRELAQMKRSNVTQAVSPQFVNKQLKSRTKRQFGQVIARTEA